MGSNQGKRPHHADRGGKVWSRDEKRENRKVMRDQAQRSDIEDSLASNSDEPMSVRKAGKPGRKWCRGKEGREHQPVEVKRWTQSWWGSRVLVEFRCAVCGHKSYKREPRA